MNVFSSLRHAAAFLGALVLLTPGCGSESDSTVAPSGCVDAPPPQKIAGACEINVTLPPVQSQAEKHVPEGTAVSYCSNPPSSGPHYAVWADFQVFSSPVEQPYLVHSLEHGAVILYWRCAAAPCAERPELVTPLREIRDNVTPDPLCNGGPRARIIVAPSTTITTDIAAAAWGATYTAACVDRPSLEAFVRDHYAKAPENFCAAGRSF